MMSMTGTSLPVAATRGPALHQPVAPSAEMQQVYDAQARDQMKMARTEEILSTNAMTARTELNFSSLDQNQDGALSVLEMDKMRPSIPPERIPGPGPMGVELAQAMVEMQESQSFSPLLPGENPVGRLLAAMRALRGINLQNNRLDA